MNGMEKLKTLIMSFLIGAKIFERLSLFIGVYFIFCCFAGSVSGHAIKKRAPDSKEEEVNSILNRDS